jgi:hypothetical protein
VKKLKIKKIVLTFILLILLLIPCLSNEKSLSVKEDDVGGSGKYPYNLRIIDNKLYAGGSFFNPETHGNSSEKVRSFMKLLKSMGVTSIIALNSPPSEEEKIAEEEGLEFYSCPMNGEKVPTHEETLKIMKLIDKKAYVHCEWGADRTGAVVGKYLRLKKGYTGYEAWEAVITGGTHAGIIGGFKKNYGNAKLLLYFWPEVVKESSQVCEIYGI